MLLNGPNLNLLGTREPDVYGTTTLSDIEESLGKIAESQNCNLICLQSNAEHELVDMVHKAKDEDVKAIVINPGALTHSSIALRDALSELIFLLLKSIFLIYMREKNLDISPFYPISPRGLFQVSVLKDMSLP